MLDSPLLPHSHGYINGRWTPAHSGAHLPVVNPANGEVLARVPNMAADQTTAAVEAAQQALTLSTLVSQRRRWLEEIERLLHENLDELARIITLEQGKPLAEAQAEVEYSAGFFRFFARHCDELQAQTLDEKPKDLTWTIHHRPAGVAALITPWNFPLAMLAKKLPAALAAGCTVVIKPAERTPLSAIALTHLAEQAGVPQGVLNLVIGEPEPIGEVLCTHPAVRLISFTGSTEVGRQLIAASAPHVKRLSLELGGNAPFIVFEDADLETAADALIANKFRCAGQTCVCANRVFVQSSALHEFTELMVARVEKLKVGNGLEPGTDLGPLINRDGWDKVARLVQGALGHGAQAMFGEIPPRPENDWGCFFPPMVLTGVTDEMILTREEIFGPVVAIAEFESEEEAIQRANNTPHGLAAYLFTQDQERAQRVSRQLQFGHVGYNTGQGPTPEAPFGGMKQSGFGREGGIEGLLEFCESQVVTGP